MTDREKTAGGQSAGELSGVVERNIRALLRRRRAEEQAKGWQDRLAARITRFTGSMRCVYVHLGIFGLWIGLNLS